jgi:D-glycero-alpha-D-manno-heptose-7-phosphate kinase
VIITRAPLRVSFLGGATDYPEHFLNHGGAVLGTSIDKYAYIAVSKRWGQLFEQSIRIAYSKVEQTSSLDDIEHAPFRECLRQCEINEDVEINYFANLPAFTGLGSSSTFVVALLQALKAYKGEFTQGINLAYEAIHMERQILKENVGCQDQVFAATGGFNIIEFRTEKDIVVNRVPISAARMQDFEDHLMLFFTGIKRSAGQIVKKQIARMGDNKDRLIKMRKLVDQGYNILTGGGSLTPFGELLHQSWLEKRSLEQSVSNDHIDDIYNTGLDCGAIGGKLLGAGGGGFVLFFVPPEKRDLLRQRLSHLHEIPIKINTPGSQIISSI